MSRYSKNTNQDTLKLTKNQLSNYDPKNILNQIKNIGKQISKPEDLQKNISIELSLLLKKTVKVNVIGIKEITESSAHTRDLHKYPQPTMILQDKSYCYRIWIEDAPQFQNIKQFRKPADTQPQIIQIKQENYENSNNQP